MKVAVYSIAKNEEKNVVNWVNSAKEADVMVVVDTGSTDKTVELLQKLGVVVHQKEFNPWRFDEARNYSLGLVSLDVDICVSLDFDERLSNGWRKVLEEVWKEGVNIISVPLNGMAGERYLIDQLEFILVMVLSGGELFMRNCIL